MRSASFPGRDKFLCLEGTGVAHDDQLLHKLGVEETLSSWWRPCGSPGAPHTAVKTAVLPSGAPFYVLVGWAEQSIIRLQLPLAPSQYFLSVGRACAWISFLKEDETQAQVLDHWDEGHGTCPYCLLGSTGDKSRKLCPQLLPNTSDKMLKNENIVITKMLPLI